eukprot:TRINITY_DN14152_c1_g3_i1.p1 TRINITY_DN14152_c1_g3~~TRINITY_DN14152_c1_g3_i1.p1  ORF type:complete len:151 (-),score=14.17 TRINITY_DN14152_c1_g3_i1:827-1279(-)
MRSKRTVRVASALAASAGALASIVRLQAQLRFTVVSRSCTSPLSVQTRSRSALSAQESASRQGGASPVSSFRQPVIFGGAAFCAGLASSRFAAGRRGFTSCAAVPVLKESALRQISLKPVLDGKIVGDATVAGELWREHGAIVFVVRRPG